ncbi:hypothetical protein H0H81_002046 [Sphagnurus paluster]|uniref:Uncharacterized protein n=1 Tax=Sphagnurus paluster TaxID=117069 RepID=A0A9P7K2R7_9AGAR|nr:hypothetical protein H0H81_002046 [Sphagnurus paluster]
MRLSIFLLYATLSIQAATAAPLPQNLKLPVPQLPGVADNVTDIVGGLKDRLSSLTGAVSDAARQITGAVNGITSSLSSAADNLKSNLSVIKDSAPYIRPGAVAGIAESAAKISAVAGQAEAVVQNLTSTVSNIVEQVSRVVDSVTDTLSNVKSQVTGLTESIKASANDVVSNLIDGVAGHLGDTSDGLKGVEPPNIAVYVPYPPLDTTYIKLLKTGD